MGRRVLMISTNRETAPQPVVPHGAAWVAESLHRHGFTVRLLDLCFERDPVREVERAVRSFEPDGIGISIRNLDNCDFLSPRSYLMDNKAIIDRIRAQTDVPLLLGGGGVSVMPEEVLEYFDVAHAVVGDGEWAAARFFGASSDEERSSTPGLVCRGKGVPAPGTAASDWIPPRIGRWVDHRRYLGYEPVLPVQGKRGCANRCVYCTYSRVEGTQWRPRPVGEVVEELQRSAAETGAREFEFVDSVYNEPEGYLETLLEAIIGSGLSARFHASSVSPRALSREQVRLMERTGFVSVVVTPESAADAVLSAMGKGFTAHHVHRAARLLADSTIRALWCFLVGGPGEHTGTLGETISFINRHLGDRDRCFVTTGIRVYPGTELHDLAVGEGLVERAQNPLTPWFYFSPLLAPDEARRLMCSHIGCLDRCIFPSDTNLAPLGSFRRIGAVLNLPTPFWRYAGPVNRIMHRRRSINRTW